MAARRSSNFRPGILLLALAIAVFLWSVAQGSSDRELPMEIPIELVGVKDDLVVTDQSATAVSLQVRGSRAALANIDVDRLNYSIDVSNVKPGLAEFEIDTSQIPRPRGARFIGHSPARITVRLEDKSRKSTAVRADIQGEPAVGFQLSEWRVVPDKVWLQGARSHVMRLADVATEPIDVSGISASEEREVRILLGGGRVWMEEEKPVTVQLTVEPVPPAPIDGDAPEEGVPAATPPGGAAGTTG